MSKKGTKERVLECLEEKRGTFFSGEELAASLMVSRTAVWKAVEDLRKEGYLIHSQTRRGYALAEENDILSPAGIRSFFPEELPGRIFLHKELSSTNNEAKRLLLEEGKEAVGTVVLAESQTRGEGHGKGFASPPGGLYMSLILGPEKDPDQLSLTAAVAVAEAIEEITGEKTKILWKTSILLDGRKTAGILTEQETDLETGVVRSLILGIGIRTDTWQNRGNSLKNRLAAGILYRVWKKNGREALSGYRERLTGLGEEALFLSADFGEGEPFRAAAEEIFPDGSLQVKLPDDRRVRLKKGCILYDE